MAPTQKFRVMDVLDRTVRQHAPRSALRVKRNGAWRTITYGEYHRQVRQVARALMTLGTRPGEGVAIIGYNSPEWFFADIGAIYAGAVPAGIYTTSSPEQCQYIAAHCEAAVVFVDDSEQLAKFLAVRDRLPALKVLVLMHGTTSQPGVLSWTKFLELGLNTSEQDLDKRIAASGRMTWRR
jgi:long-subunit acyl-CoA synthetase (AMP-forming)